jgi:DNA-binding NtrC family response regulator
MYEVLFVDDDLETANEYAELVSTFTKLRSLVCSTRTDALRAITNYQIGVVVLDQRMPEISGTELYRELRMINPQLRAIMLSAEARQAEIVTAVNLHYSQYLHKSGFRKLPAIVLREFAKFQRELANLHRTDRTYLFAERYIFGLRGSITYYLEGYFIEEENYVPDESWTLIDQVNTGKKNL